MDNQTISYEVLKEENRIMRKCLENSSNNIHEINRLLMKIKAKPFYSAEEEINRTLNKIKNMDIVGIIPEPDEDLTEREDI